MIQPEFQFTDTQPADIIFERDGAWFTARPVVPQQAGYVIVNGCSSKISFEDATRLLRRLLNPPK